MLATSASLRAMLKTSKVMAISLAPKTTRLSKVFIKLRRITNCSPKLRLGRESWQLNMSLLRNRRMKSLKPSSNFKMLKSDRRLWIWLYRRYQDEISQIILLCLSMRKLMDSMRNHMEQIRSFKRCKRKSWKSRRKQARLIQKWMSWKGSKCNRGCAKIPTSSTT